MKKIDIAAVLGLILAIFLGSFSGFSEKLDNLQKSVLRLHILANSDSEEDQALKLKVRDVLLANAENLFAGCDTLEEMQKRAVEEKETIRLLAQSVLEENGSNASVSVQLVQMDFDEKQYEEITMPAGEYTALRILIGNAQGQNWWCVMYPPLCIPAATGDVIGNTETATDYFDTETVDILEHPQQFEIKFKCVEWFREIRKKFSEAS
jgi:stage II sporulation protein R